MGDKSKAVGATVGGAVAAILAWLIGDLGGVTVPPGIEAAFATVIAAAAVYFAPANK